MKILVADDNVVFRDVLKAILTDWGYEIVTASDGDEAWSLLQQPNAPRFAVLDWIMPGMDGVEVCRKIRADLRLKRSYILMLTSKTRPEDVSAAMEAGADDYVTKPFKSHELRARVRSGCRILELQEQVMVTAAGSQEAPPTSPV